ncbi:glycoside hydrolase family 5 protein [Amanita rubescens]|nr:glycoside hydrolase family 5 protein [Amanita rubescens]
MAIDPFADPLSSHTSLDLPAESYLSRPSTPGNALPDNNGLSGQRQSRVSSLFRKKKISRRLPIFIAVISALVVIAIILPVYLFTKAKREVRLANSPLGAGTSSNPGSPTGATTGGDGSVVIMEGGTEFVYQNKFGGFWVSDSLDPFNNNARPNYWTPPLNQSWNWGQDRINGVNIGGLFVMEPFITPEYFEKYPGAVDEWSLSILMAADTANGGLDQLENHYNTFITEQDIAKIAGAGLNWIRVPIPYWAIETWPGEPFLARTCWKYILRLLSWARKYGLRVNLDLHTVPGSQNGYNHSGKGGQINFLHGVMGLANAQRTFNYIRIITEFISQPEYQLLVPIFGVVNEPLVGVIGMRAVSSFYLEVHNLIRSITGYGEGNGPYISIHDGFKGVKAWQNFLPGADRLALDTHTYLAFSGSKAMEPIATGLGSDAGGVWPKTACDSWAAEMNTSRLRFGVTYSGEFSYGYNDCGLFLRGVQGSMGPTTYGGNCSFWEDSAQWNETTKAGIGRFGMASMDALRDYFFWTWKASNLKAPAWSYLYGLLNGWVSSDPREAIGTCLTYDAVGPNFDGNFAPWQTGGAGAGTIAPTATEKLLWPPATFANLQIAVDQLPTYTPTGTIATLPPPSFTLSVAQAESMDGWYNNQDNSPAYTPVSGCEYPNPWNAIGTPVPITCAGGT